MSTAIARTYGGVVLVCFALAWIVSFAWWLLLPETRIVALEVPAGTAAAIARGEDVAVIPDSLLLRRGDTLAIRNDDVVVHQIGSELLPPATTVRIPVTSALLDESSLLCSIHPNGVVGISSFARPGILSTAIPTALAGIPVSVSAVVAMFVARRLRDEEDQPAVAGA
ncbi:MAG: hypothetical protein Q8M79_02350 [Dehalococcoidia bacterium]|nr:hypothetical protein [Dehalococcoidia bacterium]